MLLIITTPGRREVRVGILIGPARAAGTAVLVLLPSVPLLLAPQCGQSQAATIHYHLDHLGSTLAWTNGSGVLVRQIRYASYGEVRGRWAKGGGLLAPTDDDRFEWTGHETEHLELASGTWPALGLVYMGARWYDARLGQFLSLDPARQYASPFAYGGWDPVNGTDPSGAWFFQLLAGIVISLIGAAIDSTGHANVSVNGQAAVNFGGRSAGGSYSNQSAGWLLSANSLSTVRTLSQVRLIYAMAEEAGAFESPAHAPTTFGNVVSMALGLAEGGMASDSGAERGNLVGKNPLTDVVVTKGSRASYSTSLDAFRSSHLEIAAQPSRRLELGEFFTEVVRLGNGRFGYSPLRYYECTDNGCNGKWPDTIPNRWGLVHSHPNTDYPSTTDREATRRLRIPGGLVTPFRDLRFYYQDNSGTTLPLWSNEP